MKKSSTGCFAQLLDVLLCVSEIVCYKSAEGEVAGCLLSGSLRLSLGEELQNFLVFVDTDSVHSFLLKGTI